MSGDRHFIARNSLQGTFIKRNNVRLILLILIIINSILILRYYFLKCNLGQELLGKSDL